MRQPRILLHNDVTAPLAELLLERFPHVTVAECNSYEAMPDALSAFGPDIVYTVRFGGSDGFPRDAMLAQGGLRWIANGGAGIEHLGLWDPSALTVTNAAGVAADMMAEYIMGGFLHFTLDVRGLQKDKAVRRWQARMVRPLAGQMMLIVGLGHTGQALAARAKAFGMTVVGTRARPRPMENVDDVAGPDQLVALARRADFIAVCTPLTATTRGLVDRTVFDAVKPGAVLADVSRGGVIVAQDLLAALEDGRIAGAALDVFETEPLPADSAFWSMENVLISPHCSSVSEGWAQASFRLFLNNLGRWMEGETLSNVVDPLRGY
ncbi:MAG: D-2-hydroxyacid dehydrogenase [Roseobacter sp.]|jgi:phosphoglycerate dehydrogenase-like enzyme|nr:D-2-hydroxyacid dehydrogenase [Roseobacter sp.]